jgi:hypothetical protein
MPWLNNGTFERKNGTEPTFTGSNVWFQDQQASIKVIAARHDYHDDDLAQGISACLNLDGKNAMRADLDMGNNALVNVATGSGENDFAKIGQLITIGTFDNGSRELTLTTAFGDLAPIVIPAGSTTSTEGQWSPQITGATMSIDNAGYYQRDGRMVTIFGYLEWTSRTPSAVLQVLITGLPYAIAPAFPGADLGMYTAAWWSGLGMQIPGIGGGPFNVDVNGGGTHDVYDPTAEITAIHPTDTGDELRISTYFGTNDLGGATANNVYDYVMNNLSSVGKLGFQMAYFTDDPV